MKICKRTISIFLTLAILILAMVINSFVSYSAGNLWQGEIATSYSSGTGASDDPYIITTAEELALLSQQVRAGTAYNDCYFELGADIILNDTTNWQDWGTYDEEGQLIAPGNVWTPIGLYDNYAFEGYFDGKGYTVSGMYVSGVLGKHFGLFGYAYKYDEYNVKNVNVINSFVYGANTIDNYPARVGGIVGEGYAQNCTFNGKVIGDVGESYSVYTGGIAGWGGAINCEVRGSVSVSSEYGYAAGIVGYGDAEKCINYANVSGPDGAGITAHGDASYCENYGDITANDSAAGISCSGSAFCCLNAGTITSHDGYRVAGIVAGNYAYDLDTIVKYCVNKGNIIADNCSYVAGVVASGIAQDCYNTGEISATDCEYAAGVIATSGDNSSSLLIERNYNVGTVSGNVKYSMAGVLALNEQGNKTNDLFYLDSSYYFDEFAKPLTESEMKLKESFTNYNFNRVWEYVEGAEYPYPTLRCFGSKIYGFGVDFYDGDTVVKSVTIVENEYLTFEKLPDEGDKKFYAYEKDGKYYFEGDTLLITEDVAFNIVWIKQNKGSNVWDGSVDTEWKGTGSETDPYLITTAEELAGLAESVNGGNDYNGKYFTLTNDVYLNDAYNFDYLTIAENHWTPIGHNREVYSDNNEYLYTPVFRGNFNGDGHTVNGLYIKSEGTYVGLFGYAERSISNLTIDNSYICALPNNNYSNSYIGAVAGEAREVSNCISKATVEYAVGKIGNGRYSVGGVVGYYYNLKDSAYYGTVRMISYCHADEMALPDVYMGGVAGEGSTVENSINYGFVRAVNISTYNYGEIRLSGVVSSGTTIKNCKNYSDIYAPRIFKLEDRSDITYLSGIANSGNEVYGCVNYGNISGGFIGAGIVYFSNGTVEGCSNNGSVSCVLSFGIGYNLDNVIDCTNNGSISATNMGSGISYDVTNASNCLNAGDITVNVSENNYTHGYFASGMFIETQGAYYEEEAYIIEDCRNIGNVTLKCDEYVFSDHVYAAGIICDARAYTLIDRCYNGGEIQVASVRFMYSSNCLIGGIAATGDVKNSYNTGRITVNKIKSDNDVSYIPVGGIVGKGSAENCYNVGIIKIVADESYNTDEKRNVGAIVGVKNGEVKNCYYLSGILEVPHENIELNNFGEVKTGSALSLKSTFNGWDSSKIWEFGGVEGYKYPNLRFMGSGTHKYTVTFKDGANAVSKETVYNGVEITFENLVVKSGYEFVYWQNDGTYYYEGDSVTVNSDMEFTAVWKKLNDNTAWDGSIDTEFEGSGTEADPYLIGTASELAGLSEILRLNRNSEYADCYYKQTKDIYLNSVAEYSDTVLAENFWIPIGTKNYSGSVFSGVYDGNGFTVYGLYMKENDAKSNTNMGLFGYAENATFKNITLKNGYLGYWSNYSVYVHIGAVLSEGENVTVSDSVNYIDIYCKTAKNSDGDRIGGIIGFACGITAENVTNYGDVYGSTVGGIVGRVENEEAYVISFENCHNKGYVENTNYQNWTSAGGILGYLDNDYNSYSAAEFKNCTNEGGIYSKRGYAAGIIGYAGWINLSYCENKADINGKAGIVGYVAEEASVTYCTNYGDIKNDYYNLIAGIVGSLNYDSYSSIQHCDNYGDIAGVEETGGIVANGESTYVMYCKNYGNIVSLNNAAAGIHTRTESSVSGCENYGNVTASSLAGGIVAEGGYVSNSVNNGTVKGKNCVGGIIGNVDMSYATIINCSNTGSVQGEYYVGGIAGDLNYSGNTVTDCFNTGDILGGNSIGGIAGESDGTVKCSYNAGKITGKNSVGGIVGEGEAELSYNSGTVQGEYYVGGIAGEEDVTDCYNKGRVSGDYYVGGIAGDGNATRCYNIGNVTSGVGVAASVCGYRYNTVTDCYYLDSISVSSDEDEESMYNGTAVSASELLKGALSGFDWETVWTVGEVEDYDYPTLRDTAYYITYTVKFLDSDGVTVLKEQKVNKGFSAYPPTIEITTDENFVYALDHWDGEYKNITDHTTVKAVYKKTEKIKFNGINHNLTVPFGFSADNLKVLIESSYAKLLCTTTHNYKMNCDVEWDLSNYNPNASGMYELTGTLTVTESPYYEMAANARITVTVTVSQGEEDEFDQSHLLYDVNNDNTVTVTGYIGSAQEIIIPEVLGGYKVSAIGENAFADNTSVITVYIPKTVKTIGANAFKGCSALVQVTFCEGLEAVGEYAFADTALTDVTLPASLNDIGEKAFGCYGGESFAEGFTVYAFKDTAAVAYANKNGINCITVEEKTDSYTGISVIAEEGVELSVSRVLSGAYFETASAINEKANVSLFEIKIFDETDDELQPGNMMTVSVPVPAGFNDNSRVYRINADGSYMDMNAKKVDGMLVFNTAHLSYYAIVSESSTILGDVDGDGFVNTTDLAALKLKLAGTGNSVTAGADLNADGFVNTTDLAELKLRLAGA